MSELQNISSLPPVTWGEACATALMPKALLTRIPALRDYTERARSYERVTRNGYLDNPSSLSASGKVGLIVLQVLTVATALFAGLALLGILPAFSIPLIGPAALIIVPTLLLMSVVALSKKYLYQAPAKVDDFLAWKDLSDLKQHLEQELARSDSFYDRFWPKFQEAIKDKKQSLEDFKKDVPRLDYKTIRFIQNGHEESIENPQPSEESPEQFFSLRDDFAKSLASMIDEASASLEQNLISQTARNAIQEAIWINVLEKTSMSCPTPKLQCDELRIERSNENQVKASYDLTFSMNHPKDPTLPINFPKTTTTFELTFTRDKTEWNLSSAQARSIN